jgi:hypothetical protein
MFLITGSGRSGTSAVAQLLHEAGLSVGHDLIAPDEHNAEGYFEERMLIMINDAILKAAGVGAWFTTATRAQIRDASAEYADYMQELVKTATPAWKDPRLSWTLEPWLEVLPERPKIIVCLRSPAEVVASTLAYYAQGGDDAENAVKHVWRTQYERLLEIMCEYRLDAICVEYAALHADPERAAEPLARFVGRALDTSTVRRDLRHHAVAIPDDLVEMYERVLALGAAAVEP